MEIDYVHFYVEDAVASRNWFRQYLGFRAVTSTATQHTHTEVVCSGSIYFVLSSPLQVESPVAQFLKAHPPGAIDVALRVQQLQPVFTRAVQYEVEVLQPRQQLSLETGSVSYCQIAAWGTLRHTLIERTGVTPLVPTLPNLNVWVSDGKVLDEEMLASDRPLANNFLQTQRSRLGLPFTGIDHIVLNVAMGDLEPAIAWYTQVLGFQPQQRFEIQTDHSGLCSRVLVHPTSRVQLPINEPTSANSQIQEFLNFNRASGIQHIALRTENIVAALTQLRSAGLSLLQVPPTYYAQLKQRPQFQQLHADWQAIEAQQVLVDWQAETPQALLLQTFTQPIFQQPTFFFELIERQPYLQQGHYKWAEGFGEGNFRALFEAIEQEQMKRGSLQG
jgi:4-hydroxyphenylpyruvate dioxygenase